MLKNYFFSIIFLSIYSAWAQPGSQSEILTLDSYQSFQGYTETIPHLGKGQYQIFYDNINGVLDKPFIIVDGFDPDDSNTIPILYNSLTYNAGANNLLDDMRNQGMDVIILSFPTYTRTDDGALIQGGADYIERNGLVLVNLLETINAQIPINSDCIVMGVSMGGLVSRYALTFMEQNSLEHNTGLWFSFDSPHRGANVPISLQYALNYIAEYSDDDDMRAQRDLTLNSPAAKQMLLDHYTAHLQTGDPYLQNTAVPLLHLQSHPFPALLLPPMSAHQPPLEVPGMLQALPAIVFQYGVRLASRLHQSIFPNFHRQRHKPKGWP